MHLLVIGGPMVLSSCLDSFDSAQCPLLLLLVLHSRVDQVVYQLISPSVRPSRVIVPPIRSFLRCLRLSTFHTKKVNSLSLCQFFFSICPCSMPIAILVTILFSSYFLKTVISGPLSRESAILSSQMANSSGQT